MQSATPSPIRGNAARALITAAAFAFALGAGIPQSAAAQGMAQYSVSNSGGGQHTEVGQRNSPNDGVATGFRTGGNSADRYLVQDVTINIADRGGSPTNFQLYISEAQDQSGTPIPSATGMRWTLTGPGSPGNGAHTYTPAAPIILSGATDYVVWAIAPGNPGPFNWFGVTVDNNDAESGSPGWSIANNGARTTNNGSTWTSQGQSMVMRVRADYVPRPLGEAASIGNLGQSNSGSKTVGAVSGPLQAAALAFSTGGRNVDFYRLNHVVTSMRAPTGNAAGRGPLVVSIHTPSMTNTAHPGTAIAGLQGAAPAAAGEATYTAGAAALQGDSNYFVVWRAPQASGSNNYFNINVTGSNAEDAGASPDWSIGNTNVDGVGDGQWLLGSGDSAQMQISATVVAADIATVLTRAGTAGAALAEAQREETRLQTAITFTNSLITTAVTSSLTAQGELNNAQMELAGLRAMTNDAVTMMLPARLMELVDLTGDNAFNQNDFLLHYYANSLADLVGDGSAGSGSAHWRQALLAPHAGAASDADLVTIIARVRALRAIAPPLTAAQLSNLGNVDSGGAVWVGTSLLGGTTNAARAQGFTVAEEFVLRDATFRVGNLQGNAVNRGALNVAIHSAAGGAGAALPAAAALAALSGTTPTAAGEVTYSAPGGGVRLAAGTYFLVLEAPGISTTRTSFNVNVARNGNEDAGAPAGWSIADSRHFRGGAGAAWTSAPSEPLAMRLRGGTPVP